MTKFLLDSGDPNEYKEIATLAKEKDAVLWGSTTNPSLIAKKIAASERKLTPQEAFSLQKEIILEIVDIVLGAVSGEVYADLNTSSLEMVEQGRGIASWHPRVVVKLPTNLEGFKARTILRKEGIGINNTLVFSQQQVYAIALHEKLLQDSGAPQTAFPAFISPFLGRLDDKGENGLEFLEEGIFVKNEYFTSSLTWMLSASIRNTYHFKKTLDLGCELITAPANIYKEWFALTPEEQQNIPNPTPNLAEVPAWVPTEEIKNTHTIDEFMSIIESGTLDISHPLTTSGIDKFVADWHTILS